MNSSFFHPLASAEENGDSGVFVMGAHVPAQLVKSSGIWVNGAGSAILSQDAYDLEPQKFPLFLIVDRGEVAFSSPVYTDTFSDESCVVLPPFSEGCTLSHAKNARLLWLTLEGKNSTEFLRQINALNLGPARQGILPTQVRLVRQMVQVMVRHTGTGEASFQLSQLLWGVLAAHSGQSVAMNATISHEIARVLDALRANQYRDNFSLAEMAAISRMSIEAFRKRFVSEMGVPPVSFQHFLKMERAKALLRSGLNVRKTGLEIGMPDPYHFSKQFKQVVGVSPNIYRKQVGAIS